MGAVSIDGTPVDVPAEVQDWTIGIDTQTTILPEQGRTVKESITVRVQVSDETVDAFEQGLRFALALGAPRSSSVKVKVNADGVGMTFVGSR